ncbi:MAG: GDP-mannose mannosyl hydrolase [Parcubacteria group bacterium Athens0416_74]|nr:MAG: GDP-mannose mannosyl hydrolase [Parcubacteria group bacterium Athens0416_74]
MSKLPVGGRIPLDRYRQLMDDGPIVTVDVMFLNPERTKLLLGKRTNEPYKDEYFSFGGRLYKNEEFIDAARRITKEEIGLDILESELTFAGVTADFGNSSIFEGVTYHSVDIFYVCTIPEDLNISLDAQHDDTKWFSLDDTTLHPFVQNRIKGVKKTLNLSI